MKKLFMVLFTLVILCACTNGDSEVTPTPTPTSTSDLNACVIGDENCNSEDVIASELMDWEVVEFTNVLDYTDGTKILFFSFDDCPYCIEAIPVLDDIIKNEYANEVEIYYVHTTREQREDGDDDYDRVYEYFKDVLDEGGYDKIYMPTAMFIKDGEVVACHVGTVDGHTPSEAAMTEDQIQELHDIYVEAIEKMLA